MIVPWRHSDERRWQLWSWCRSYWVSHYPEFELVECDSGDEAFTRGRSINEGVEKSSGEILLLADADTLVGHVEEAVRLAEEGNWVVAYPAGMYCALTEQATDVLLKTDPSTAIRACT